MIGAEQNGGREVSSGQTACPHGQQQPPTSWNGDGSEAAPSELLPHSLEICVDTYMYVYIFLYSMFACSSARAYVYVG